MYHNKKYIAENHMGRIWEVSTHAEKYSLFKENEIMRSYLDENQFMKIPS